ncbi:hypothetical protein CS022_14920 [Veronia nyctiphanis]|uniref:Calx-beta domain-containing protein n=1 Tax=Veronia nyctiphanis TaxID=1278244 RepID=A0A4Q0YPU0_9GAMM|nr:Calx-beta domain-containing protein [Veronia nyctiphanis]RXJ71842.1 hypothetical protein CS022_19460 [Veronia nyctiphanis]RXJ72593.1 hypothetical protein CS022_14920 [Veronia nyctiphanis]
MINDDADIPRITQIANINGTAEGSTYPWNKWSVQLSHPATSDRTVELAFNDSGHQAMFGDDYSGRLHVYTSAGGWVGEYYLNASNSYTASINVPAGITDLHVNAEVSNDNVYEGNETFVIYGRTDGQGWVTSADSIITDDQDIPVVSTINSLQSGSESSWPGWTLNLSNASTTSTVIRLNVNDGLHTADILSDYTGKLTIWNSAGTVKIGELVLNSSNAYAADIAIPANHSSVLIYAEPMNDDIYEGTETLTIQARALYNQASYITSQPSNIDDSDDRPSVTSVSDYTVVEGGYAEPVNVTLSKVSALTTRVEVYLDDGSATVGGGDFSESEFWVRFNGGSWVKHSGTIGSGHTIDVPAGVTSFELSFDTHDDNIYEGNENYSVWVRVEGDSWNGTSGRGYITLNDDADKPTVSSVSSTTVTEGQDAIVTVSLTNASTSATSVWLDAWNGSALGGNVDHYETLYVDFNDGNGWQNKGSFASGQWLSVPANTSSFSVKVGSVDNSVNEATESFTIRANAENQSPVIGTVTINDNDPMSVTSVSNFTVAEGGYAEPVTVTLSTTSTQTTRVEINLDNGSATTADGDYSDSEFWVRYPAGSWQKYTADVGSGYIIDVPAGYSSFELSLKTLNNNVFEGNENFSVWARVEGESWTGSKHKGVITLTDDSDKPTVSSVSSTTVTEGQDASVTVTLSNTSTSATSIWLDAWNGSALGGNVDHYETLYVNFNDGNGWQNKGSFASGQWLSVPANTSSFSVKVGTVDNSVNETTESFTIRANAENQSPVIGTVTINDNDPIHVSNVSNVSVTENGYAYPVVTLNRSSDQTTRVQIDLDSASAAAGSDFSESEFWVRFGSGSWQHHTGNIGSGYTIDVPAGHSSFDLSFKTHDDNVYEGNETFSVWARVEGDSWNSSSGKGVVTISDNDSAPVLTSNLSNINAWEGHTPFHTFTMSSQSANTTNVTLQYQNGTASAGYDFNSQLKYRVSGTSSWSNYTSSGINLAANTNSFDVLVETYEDSHYEGGEKYTLKASTQYQSGWASAGVTIFDNDAVTRNSEGLWDLNGVKQLQIRMQNLWNGGWPKMQSSLGYYVMDNNGNIIDVEVMISRIADYNNGSKNVTAYVNNAASMGLFLIPDGANFGYTTGDASISLTNDGAKITQGNKTHYVLLSEGYKNHGGFDNELISGTESKWEDIPGGWFTMPWPLPALGPDYADVSLNVEVKAYDFVTPIVIDLDGDGIQTLSSDVSHIHFDLNADGVSRITGWVSNSDAFLVWDKNRDGVINDGSEMFGEGTLLSNGERAQDGFQALREHDVNADGKIDITDAIFPKLNVWVDKNTNGLTDVGELISLAEANIASLNLNLETSNTVNNDNLISLIGSYTTIDGKEYEYADVWFRQRMPEISASETADTSSTDDTAQTEFASPDLQKNAPVSGFVPDDFFAKTEKDIQSIDTVINATESPRMWPYPALEEEQQALAILNGATQSRVTLPPTTSYLEPQTVQIARPMFEGKASAGAEVSIELLEQQLHTHADDNGDWAFTLPAGISLAEGGNDYTLSIQQRDGSSDIMYGRVIFDREDFTNTKSKKTGFAAPVHSKAPSLDIPENAEVVSDPYPLFYGDTEPGA